ncbi:MAG: hypothetical protein KDD42_08970, partial [Bdellovibrionales bacterium]|nr:hypothetical protein [Bdellovibrionales bacterium]
PEFLPIIDYSLNKIQVPTHDKWSMAKFGLYLEKAGKYLKTEEAYANQQIELDYSNGVAAMNWKEDIRAERNS